MAESKSAALPLGYAPKRIVCLSRARYSGPIRQDQCIPDSGVCPCPALPGSVDPEPSEARLVAPWKAGVVDAAAIAPGATAPAAAPPVVAPPLRRTAQPQSIP